MKKTISLMLLISFLIITTGCDNGDSVVIEENSQEAQKTIIETDYSMWDELKNKDNIIGKSDKDFKELTKSKPLDVRNDATGKWKKSTISENVNLEEYLLSYVDLYMEDGDVHFIINFNYNTTTRVNYSGGLINATIMEYEKREEHDAKTIGSGMLLKSYTIYPDGDIEEVE